MNNFPDWRGLSTWWNRSLLSGRGLGLRPELRRRREAVGQCLYAVVLEDRTMLSTLAATAGVVPASGIAPLWFQSVPAAPQMASPQVASTVATADLGLNTELSTAEWIVQFDKNAVSSFLTVGQTASLLNAAPVSFQVVRGLGGVGEVLIETWGGSPETVAAWFRANTSIAGFQRDQVLQISTIPNDPSFSSLYGLENTGQTGGTVDADIDATAAWELTTGSNSVVVGVIDTGIDYTHPDLAANIWTNPGETPGDGIDNDGNGFVDDVHGWDFVNHDSNPMDDNQHGTHVSGTIGAVGNNGVGVVGVNWNVSLMALKVFDSSGSGTDSDAIAALNYAAMMRERGVNIRVTNNSWGGGGYDPALYDAIASQCDAGVLFVAAAGNSHSNNNATPFYPASYDLDNIIAVAATTNTDALASFSSYGLTTVDLAAPGTSILSTTPGNTYGSLSGTSMATPHVVGVAALAMSLAPDANYQQIRAAVLGGVDPRASLSGIVASGGRLNAAGTLNYLLSHAAATPSNYLAAATTYEPIDLNPADSGVVTVLDGVDDGAAAIDLGVNTFTFYGTTYTGASSLFVSSNGLITFGSANPTAANTNLSASPSQAAIAPFWDDLRTDLDGAADLVLSRFEDTTGDSVRDRLVIEWSSVRHAPGSPSPATFQAVLQLDTGSSDGNIVFNYGDLDFGDATVDNGAGATVGLKAAGAQGLDRLLVAKNNGVHPLIGSGRAILFERTRPVGDIVDVAPDPHLSSVPSVDVTFTRPIDLASFDFHDVTLTRNGGANLITSAVTVSFVSGSTYRINGLTNITGYDGTYAATVNMGGIADLVGQHGTGSISDTWTADNPPPDIQMLSATANGSTTLTVTYEVLTSPVDPFNLGVYRSSDATVGGDVLLATVSLSATADTTVGTHVKTFTIGSGAGQIALPAAGAAEVDADYFLLFVADPTDAIPETDASSPGDNNVVAFAGVYHAAKNLVQVHGSGAADTVTVSATPGVTYNGTTSTYSTGDVTGLRIRAHGGNDVVNAAAYTKPLLAFGGDGNDTLTGGTGADVLDGGAGDDTLAGNAGNDSYIFDADTPLGSDTLADSAGIDTLDFSATTTHAITVNLSLTTVQTVNANLGLTLGSNAAFENVIGGALGDSMTGNTLANLITGGPGDDTLAGASGNDTYVFDADAALGSDTLVEATGGGTETLDFSSTTTQAIAVNLSTTTTQVVNGNVSLTLSAADTFESVTGGALGDTLTGNALANTLTGGAGNDELAGGAGNDNLVGGAGDDTLAGGDDKDTYIFDADSALGSDTIAETAGADTLDFSPTSTKTIAFNLSVTTPQVVAAGNLTLTLGAGDAIENLTGGSLDDVLIGNALANTLTGNAGNDMLTGNDGNDVLVGGAGADLLKGGNGDDKYSFDADSALGSDTIDELVGAGVDTLDFSATTTQGLTVNLSLGSTQVVNGNLTLTLGAGDVIDRVIGGSLDDVLIGNALANTLTGGAGNDTLTGNDGNDVLVGGVGNDLLTGGNGDDVYAFDADAALGSDTLAESAGVDLLDFSQTTTVAIAINLASTSAQPVNGNLNLTLLSGGDLEMVVGSSKNDTILGNSLNNVLIGGAGNDTIGGLGGLDLVVGGTGVDNLNGGDDDDLLIAGKLSYYDESTLILNRPAIDAVMAEWTRIDLAYDLRIDHLKNGTGLNGTFKLDSTTVLADGSSIDTMIGEAGLDWFWKFGSDAIADLGNGGIEAFN